jgi:hypothetical protein
VRLSSLVMRIKKAIVFGHPITPLPLIYNEERHVDRFRKTLDEIKKTLLATEIDRLIIVEDELAKARPDHGLIQSMLKAGGKLTSEVIAKISEDMILKAFL